MTATGRYLLEAQLPQGLTCSQCVIQWKWHTGKHWVNTGYAVVIRCIILQANSMRNQNKFDSLVKITVYKWLKVKQVGQSFFFYDFRQQFRFWTWRTQLQRLWPTGRILRMCWRHNHLQDDLSPSGTDVAPPKHTETSRNHKTNRNSATTGHRETNHNYHHHSRSYDNRNSYDVISEANFWFRLSRH